MKSIYIKLKFSIRYPNATNPTTKEVLVRNRGQLRVCKFGRTIVMYLDTVITCGKGGGFKPLYVTGPIKIYFTRLRS